MNYRLPQSHPLNAYFEAEANSLCRAPLDRIATREEWEKCRGALRNQLQEMLGLLPAPEHTPLMPVVTGVREQLDFTVELIHFQASPGLYVTGNLYVPKGLDGPAPTILYVCGHASGMTDGIHCGHKVKYQQHGIWFAQRGYVSFIIDTIQMGEIPGVHHGTYRKEMWWWKSRGYTPAGIEAWTSIRAIDYLETRPEVDRSRIGMTGRSGGGAYSWFVAAIDERIAAVVPVAGITDIHNHVVDGVVEGHCDCMYFVNTYRWDFSVIAALIAPRPLLISNSDNDHIFPLDGVMRIHREAMRIYEMYDARENLGLLITPGPHRDSQDLQVPAMRWFNRFLRDDTSPVPGFAQKLFQHHQIKVFETPPEDSINGEIHKHFVPMAEHSVSAIQSRNAWDTQVSEWKEQLLQMSFRGWPEITPENEIREAPERERKRNGVCIQRFHFTSQKHVDLTYGTVRSANSHPQRIRLRVLGQQEWADDVFQLAEDMSFSRDEILVLFAPRGVGATNWDDGDERRQVHIRRRFMLIGQTLAAMRVWDIRRAIQVVRDHLGMNALPLTLEASNEMAVNALYAAFFEPSVSSLKLSEPVSSHMQGPSYLNVLRILDIPQVVAATASRIPVVVETQNGKDWHYATEITERFNFESGGLRIVQYD